LRIAILSCFYPFRGGISQFNSCLFQELSKLHTVKAFNFKRQYPDILFPGKTQYVTEDDVAVPVESEALLDTANPLSYLLTARKIREWNPDLLIMRYWMSYFAPSLGYVAHHMKKGCKVVSVLDNVIPHEQHFFDRPFTNYFLGGQSGYVVLCDAVGKDLVSIKPKAKYVEIPHPLYGQFGEKLPKGQARKIVGVPENLKTLLFFGLIRDYKGLVILLKAFEKLDSTFALVIAGEPYGSFDKYQALIEASPNRERIYTNTNYIKDSQVSAYFSSADVCVLPYRSATQSGISNISFYYDLPLITTDVGGLKEMIADKGLGLVVSEITSEAIADSILNYFGEGPCAECITEKEMKENIGNEKERLSWSNFCKDLLEFCNSL
jgi:glycosyltransferase involved in cell wall biosynthesis